MRDTFPSLLREHRTRRRWSQLRLGHEAGVSARHLSCLETGRARPSRDMVLALARALDLALRDRNALLLGAGFAPRYPASPLDGRAMAPLQRAIDLLFAQQEPYGAVLVDRSWRLLRANRGAARLLGTFLDPAAAPPEVAENLLRATLHPAGLRPAVANWDEIAAIALDRLTRAVHAHPADAALAALLAEVRGYPGVVDAPTGGAPAFPAAVIELRRGPVALRLFTLVTTLGTPLDVTAEELAIESFFPADEATERWFRA